MAGTGRKKAVKENQEKKSKQKRGGTAKAKAKKGAPLEQHEKEGAKKTKVLRPKKLVHNPLDRIRQTEPLKGASQQHVYHFTGCLKERNVVSRQSNMRSSAQKAPSQVPERESAQIFPKKDCFLEKPKKLEKATKRRLPSISTSPKKGCMNVVPLQLVLRNVTVPIFPFEEATASHRTMSRAQALVENMAMHSHLNTPSLHGHLQGLSALVPDFPLQKPKLVEIEANCLKEDVTHGEAQEERKFEERSSTKSRQTTPSFENWRPIFGSQKILKPQNLDWGQWQQKEMERQQDRRFAQKKALRKKELRYFRRLEGVGRDVDDHASNFTLRTPQRDNQSIANFPIREDVEERGGRCVGKLVKRGWRNAASELGSVSMSSFGPNRATFSDEHESMLWSRLTTCETKQTNTELVVALSLANARRERMRKELAHRLEEERGRKKLFLAQERAAAKSHRTQCTRCC